jgi:hypothetical protein
LQVEDAVAAHPGERAGGDWDLTIYFVLCLEVLLEEEVGLEGSLEALGHDLAEALEIAAALLKSAFDGPWTVRLEDMFVHCPESGNVTAYPCKYTRRDLVGIPRLS